MNITKTDQKITDEEADTLRKAINVANNTPIIILRGMAQSTIAWDLVRTHMRNLATKYGKKIETTDGTFAIDENNLIVYVREKNE